MELGGGVPEELRPRARAWRSAEDAIYPLAVTDTAAYETSVQLVGLLRTYFDDEATTIADLEPVADRAPAVLRSLAARQGLSTAGVDVEAVVGCAAAARLRALLTDADVGAATEQQAIDEARAAGLTWAVVAEPDLSLASLGITQKWVECHIASGARLVRSIHMDPETGAAGFTIEVVAPGESQPSMRLELDTRQEWLEEAEELRATFDRLEMGI